MIWTILACLCVLATKFLTSVRLRGLKARLEAVQPKIDDLRFKLAEIEEEVEELKLQVTQKTELFTALQDAVRTLEESIKQPATDIDALEREQLVQSIEKEASVT